MQWPSDYNFNFHHTHPHSFTSAYETINHITSSGVHRSGQDVAKLCPAKPDAPVARMHGLFDRDGAKRTSTSTSKPLTQVTIASQTDCACILY